MAGEKSQEKLEVLLQIKDLATAALQRFETKTGTTAKKSEQHFARSEAAVDRLRRGILRMGAALAAVFAARKILSTLTGFEQGLVGVGKTADISGAALDVLGEQFIGLSRKIPVGVGQLLEIGRAAGQLGVQGAPNILKFTETVARLAAASADFQGEEAATTLARFLTVTGEGVGDVDRLASTITDLGNKTAATEREIALAGLSVGQATAIFNIGAANAAAFGAALSQLGVQTDLAGSTIGRTFRAIDAALREQGKGAATLVQITGKSVEELSDIFRTDAVAGFQVFLKGLQNVVESGGDASKVLADLNIADIRIQKVLPVLSKNYDLLARKIAEARREWEENLALSKESNRAWATLGSSLTKLGNTFSAAILGLRDNRDAMNEMAQGATRVVEHFFGMESATGRFTAGVVAVSSALKIATAALVGFATAKVLTWLVAVTSYLKRATTALLALNFAAKANPLVALASVTAAAGAALFLFTHHAEAATEQTNALAESAQKLAESWQDLDLARQRGARGRQTGDARVQVEAIRTELRLLEKAVELEKKREELKRKARETGDAESRKALGELPAIDAFLKMQLLKQTDIEAMLMKPAEVIERLKERIQTLKNALVGLRQAAQETDLGAVGDGANKAIAAIDKVIAKLKNELRALKFEDQDEQMVARLYGPLLEQLEGYEFDAKFDRLVKLVKKIREAREEQEKLSKVPIPVGFRAGFTSVVSQFDEASERLTILGESVAQGMLDVFTIEFFDPMTGRFKALEDVARSTLLNIANAIQRVISQQIALWAVSGIAGRLGITLPKLAQGGVVDNGRLVKAQQGVVVNAPTVISGGRGPGVLTGEAHQPEGVFPLVRDKSGDLGIRAVGGDGGSVITLHYAPVIQTQPGTDENALAQLLHNDFDRQMSRWFVGQMSRGTPVRRSVIEGVKRG